jgi:hypothetical protein
VTLCGLAEWTKLPPIPSLLFALMLEKRKWQMQNLHRLKDAFTTILTHRSGLLQFVNIAPHVADVAEDIIAAVD